MVIKMLVEGSCDDWMLRALVGDAEFFGSCAGGLGWLERGSKGQEDGTRDRNGTLEDVAGVERRGSPRCY